MKVLQKSLALYLASWLLLPPGTINAAQTDQSAGQSATEVVKQTTEELEQLVAPIALYPDALVSQILAGATYPTEIVEADRWVQDHPNLKGKDLANAVDQQTWDPSIKALTQFPSVLAKVTEEKTIVIEPADPEVVYVPAFDPWIVYGAPVVVWPGWYAYPGLYVAGPGISFSVGFGIGFFAGFGWGWHGWGCDWGHRTVIYNHNTFISNSKTFYGGHGGHQGFHDFGAARGYEGSHGIGAGRGYEGSRSADARGGGFHGRGSSDSHAEAGTRSGAFGGYEHGGTTRSNSDRGSSSLHGRGSGGRH